VKVYVIGGDPVAPQVGGLAAAGHDLEALPGPDAVALDDVRPDPKWRDTDTGRTITRAELARAAAHHAAWERIARAERPALVVEAGAEVPGTVPQDAGVDYLLVAGPAPALAYLVTPAGASRLLVTSPRRRLVPITKDREGEPYTDHFRVLAVGAIGPDGELTPSRALASASSRGVSIAPVEWLADGLVDLDDDDLVLAVPADALVHAGSRALLDAYARLDAEVVMSVDEEAVMGPARALRTLLTVGGPAEAAAAAAVEAEHEAHQVTGRAGEGADAAAEVEGVEVELGDVDPPAFDRAAELFCVVGPGRETLLCLNGRLLNPATGGEPLVVTSPEPQHLDGLVADLAAPGTRDLVRVLRYDDARAEPAPATAVGPEILRVPLWTADFCATVIRAAEAVGRWSSDPDDPVPGRELSLAAISPQLHRALEEHFARVVWPALQEHWPAIDFDGFQDAFVIKDTAHEPAGLRIHHDLSQVSASVRLNDGYDGGRLEFPRQHVTNDGVPVGVALVWPSLVTHPHRAQPVTRGVKYGLTIWCRIPGQALE
jgi:hypothetical protein